MDPLTRGSLFHRVQAEFFRALEGGARAAGHARRRCRRRSRRSTPCSIVWPPSTPRRSRRRSSASGATKSTTCGATSASGCRSWPTKSAWEPKYFEFSFGLSDEGRDPRSLPDPVVVDGRFVLHGSVDLIERHRDLDVLRVTDHKTGKNRSNPDLIVGGGAVLQPVLYSVAIEQGLGTEGRRRAACSTARPPAASPSTRSRSTTTRAGRDCRCWRSSIARSSTDFSPPRPAKDACRWCDFRPVCGPREEERVGAQGAGSRSPISRR